jgi:hypothetical protein
VTIVLFCGLGHMGKIERRAILKPGEYNSNFDLPHRAFESVLTVARYLISNFGIISHNWSWFIAT